MAYRSWLFNNPTSRHQLKQNTMKTITLFLFITVLQMASMAQFHGDIDSSFGTNGYITYDLKHDNTYDVARQAMFGADGKLYLSGVLAKNPQTIFITRLDREGRMDSTFGNNGLVEFNPSIGTSDGMYGMAMAPGGKVVVAGYAGPNPTRNMVARFLPNGGLDAGFGGAGFLLEGGQYNNRLYTCAVEPDGKVLVAGMVGDNPGNNLLIARYLENGQPDPNFGFGGVQVFDWAVYERIQKMITAGLNRTYLLAVIGTSQHVVALNNAGTPIATFGNNGKVALPETQGQPTINEMMLMPNGRILLFGSAEQQGGGHDAIVMMMNQDGTLDNTFGIGGIYRADLGHGFDDGATWAHVLMDGSILFSGMRAKAGGAIRFTTFMLASDGTLISGYGVNGVKEYEVDGSLMENYGLMAVANDGTVYLVGSSSFQTGYDLVVMRLLTSEPTVGIQELQSNPIEVQGFPNPVRAGEQLHLSFGSKLSGMLSLEVHNITGQVVYRSKEQLGHASELALPIPALPQGQYFIRGLHSTGVFVVPLQVF